MFSSRLGLRSFFGRGGLLCRSSSAMYSSAFVAIRSLFLSRAEIGSLRRDVTASERCERPSQHWMIHALQAAAANNSGFATIQLRRVRENRAAETTDHLSGNKCHFEPAARADRRRCIISS